MKKTLILLVIITVIGLSAYLVTKTLRAPEEPGTDTPQPITDEPQNPPPSDIEPPVEDEQPPVTSSDNPLPGSVTQDAPTPPAIDAIKKDLALILSIPEEEIVVISSVEQNWPDACLGLAGDDEICAQMITPGFEVILRAQETEYRYRTNADGSVGRKSPYNY